MNKKNNNNIMPFLICGLAALFYVYDYFIQVTPSVITVQLMHDLTIGAAGLSILGSCFYYSYALMQIPAGILLDRFGARLTLSFAVAISAIGVIFFGTAHSLATAGAARFLIGFGSAFSFISTLFLAARWFSHRRFALIAGLTQLAASLGSIFGLAPIAILTSHYSWRHIMTITGIITLTASLFYWLIIRDGHNSKINSISKNYSFLSSLRNINNKPQVFWIACAGFLSWVPVATIGALWGTPYLAQALNISTAHAGKSCSLFWVGLAIGSPLVGWYSNHISRRCRPMIIAFSIGLIAAIILIYASALPLWLTLCALFLLGGSASVQSLTFGVIKDNVSENVFATASGLNNMAAIIGGALAQMSVGFILSLTSNDYRASFCILPLAAFAGMIISKHLIKETRCNVLS